MRSKEAFAYSRSTGYFCSVATDHPAARRRVTPRRAGACHDTTGVERHDKAGAQIAASLDGANGVMFPYLPLEHHASPPASVAVTTVTDLRFGTPLFFGRRVIDVQSPNRRPPTTALSKKLHSVPSSIRRIIQPRGWRVLAFSTGGDGG